MALEGVDPRPPKAEGAERSGEIGAGRERRGWKGVEGKAERGWGKEGEA